MTKDDICKWMHMAWNTDSAENLKRKFEYYEGDYLPYERFAKLVAEHERERVAKWMIEQSYATGHGDTIEDLLKHLDWQARDYAQKLEREACARICDDQSDKDGFEGGYANECAERIRARGEK